MTRQDAAKLVAALKALYPRQELSAETVSAYARMLEDLDYQAAEAAVKEHAAKSPFFPAVAEIRLVVVERQLGLPSPVVAWEQVREVVDKEREFSALDEVTKRAVHLVGGLWEIRLCETPLALRSQFLKVFKELRDGAVTRGTVDPIAPLEREERKQLPPPVPMPALRSIE